jgi:hypothetical protein
MLRKVMIAMMCATGAALYLAAPAAAEPGYDPCEFAVNYLCKFIPIAPELEGSVDLTQQLPPADPNVPPPESIPVVVDPCAAGCI